MGFNGANFVFRGTGAKSPHGWSLPSGSHVGNKNYYSGIGGGVNNSLFVDIRNSSTCHSASNSCGSYGMYDTGLFGGVYGGGGCCGGSGINDKALAWGLGIGAGLGLLTSPLGGAIFKGIGGMFKGIGKGLAWCGKGIGKAATWTWDKLLKPAGKGIWNGIKAAGQGIGKAATWTWNKVLKPVGEGIWNGIKSVGKGIGNFFSNCWNKLFGKDDAT